MAFRVSEEGTSLGMFARMSFISANGIILLHYFQPLLFLSLPLTNKFFFDVTYLTSLLFPWFTACFFLFLLPHNISKHDCMTHSITLSPLHKLIDQIGLSFANNFQHNFSVCVSGLSNVCERKSISSICFIFFSMFFFLSLYHTISLFCCHFLNIPATYKPLKSVALRG